MKFRWIFCFFFLISITACAQKKAKTMTVKERVDYIESKVQRYDYEPQFQMDIVCNTSYRILINDIPVYSHFRSGIGDMRLHINTEILKSGIQRFEVQLFPKYIDIERQKEYLDEDLQCDIEIAEFSWARDLSGKTEEIPVLEYSLPKYDKQTKRKIEYSKLKEFKDKEVFEVKVPYNLTGWSDGEVFDPKDSMIIKPMVEAFYKRMIKAFSEKDLDYINEKYFRSMIENDQTFYFTRKEIEQDYINQEKNLKADKFSVKPLENYELKFYGDNRVLMLERLVNDKPYKGKSALITEYTNERGDERVIYRSILLYKPKGSDSLVLIR